MRVPADDLTPGDVIYLADGQPAKVTGLGHSATGNTVLTWRRLGEIGTGSTVVRAGQLFDVRLTP